jgi:hypothetical protein
MATKYLDHGLYAAWSATPGAGVCQDGDGTSSGAATIATCSIDLTGYTAAAGNTVTIAGAQLTCVASGAGANQFNAGSGSTLAANLAAAIIQTANTNLITVIGASNPLLGWTACKLQDILYATSSGATLNIQTRAGSAAFNGTSFFAVTSTGLTGGSQLNAQFSGGAGGAWGYLVNHLATFGKSNWSIGQYGCWGTNKPIAGVMDLGDRIRVRASKTLQFATNSNTTITFAAMGSATQPVLFEIDDGTTWPADGSSPVFKIACTWTSNSNITFQGLGTTFCHIKSKRYSSSQRNLVMEASATSTSLAGFVIAIGNTPMTWENLLMDAPGNSQTSTAINALKLATSGSLQVRTRMIGCRQVWAKDNNSMGGFVTSSINGSCNYSLEAHEFVVNDCTNAISPILAPSSGGNPVLARYTDCKFIGFISTCRLMTSGNISSGGDVSFRNCDFGAIKDRGPNVALGGAGNTTMAADSYTAESKYGYRDFLIDRRNGFCEWNSAKGYPTASARLLDGVTPWVIYAIPATYNLMLSRASPFELPTINKVNTLATGDRTVTLNFAVESTLSWTMADISFMATYLDSTGGIRYVDSLDVTGNTALTPDTTTVWSSEAGGAVSYSGQTFAKKQISLFCPDMANGCEVSIYIRLHASVANATLGTFIDPELKVV